MSQHDTPQTWTLAQLDAECNRLWCERDSLKAQGFDKERGGEYDRVLYRLRDLCRLRSGMGTA